ncbi:glutamate receptor 1-like [Amphibalanus amphitrite]|uniref:glutamate receptor 1-like n=1 Tax=Amphibalanus amphitrite TaxID=1232801 RepID=UPI001C8FB28A|nr:glutamate receptor 1-like [Amphibalanus amphitrite]
MEELRMPAIHDPPYFIINRLGNGSFSFSGFLFDIWTILADQLKLRYRITPLSHGGFGSLGANDTWTGMIGELVAGRADLSIAGYYFQQDRAQVIDFVDAVPMAVTEDRFYVPRGGSTGAPAVSFDMFSSLLKPLHRDVWWLLLCALMLVAVVVWAAVRFNHVRAESAQTLREMSWGSCLLSSFMTLVCQSWVRTPDSLAARTAVLSGWLLGVLIYQNYTAILISYLTWTTVPKPISNLQEFFAQPEWVFSIEPGMGILNSWKASENVYERELSNTTTATNTTTNNNN